MVSPLRSSVRRLFFGLLPPSETRARLVALNRLLGEGLGRKVADDNLHVTLFFIGASDALDCLRDAAAKIALPAFTLSFDRLGWFGRARVVWAGCSETSDALLRLAAACRAVSLACGAAHDERAFQAHCTLRRKVNCAPPGLAFDPITWPVERFYLMESRSTPTGVRYTSLAEFSLHTDPQRPDAADMK